MNCDVKLADIVYAHLKSLDDSLDELFLATSFYISYSEKPGSSYVFDSTKTTIPCKFYQRYIMVWCKHRWANFFWQYIIANSGHFPHVVFTFFFIRDPTHLLVLKFS